MKSLYAGLWSYGPLLSSIYQMFIDTFYRNAMCFTENILEFYCHRNEASM